MRAMERQVGGLYIRVARTIPHRHGVGLLLAVTADGEHILQDEIRASRDRELRALAKHIRAACPAEQAPRTADILQALRALAKEALDGAEVRRAEIQAELEALAAMRQTAEEPWPEPVDGAALLQAIAREVTSYIVLPPGGNVAVALWILHTHALEAVTLSPYLAPRSPVPRCGKTRLLELLAALVPRPLPTANVTPAALYHAVEAYRPTLLIDEADTFMAKSAELRGLLNAGHAKATAFVYRIIGGEQRRFSTWGAKAIALIGGLPPTLEDRSIVLPMRRRARHEPIACYRRERVADRMADLRRQAARWGEDHLEELHKADPEVPGALHDRAADNWRILFAIADATGGKWPAQARRAAALLARPEDERELVPAIGLLADLEEIFASAGADRLPTHQILAELVKREEAPWREWRHGRAISPRGLAQLLRPFGVTPGKWRAGGITCRGYVLASLQDPFARYLSRR